MLAGLEKPTKKPDIDNIGKVVMDALNKIAFDDDSQVIKLLVEKVYGEEPRVEITIGEIEYVE